MNLQLLRTLISLFVACTLFSPTVIGAAKSPESAVYMSSKTKKTKSLSASLHTTPIILTLEKIEVVKTAEQLSADDIYVNITEYSSVDKPTMHRVPEYPSHWLSKFADKVKLHLVTYFDIFSYQIIAYFSV